MSSGSSGAVPSRATPCCGQWRAWKRSPPTLAPLKPIIVAVERAGTKADNDVARALLACEANRRQRKARRARQGGIMGETTTAPRPPDYRPLQFFTQIVDDCHRGVTAPCHNPTFASPRRGSVGDGSRNPSDNRRRDSALAPLRVSNPRRQGSAVYDPTVDKMSRSISGNTGGDTWKSLVAPLTIVAVVITMLWLMPTNLVCPPPPAGRSATIPQLFSGCYLGTEGQPFDRRLGARDLHRPAWALGARRHHQQRFGFARGRETTS